MDKYLKEDFDDYLKSYREAQRATLDAVDWEYKCFQRFLETVDLVIKEN